MIVTFIVNSIKGHTNHNILMTLSIFEPSHEIIALSVQGKIWRLLTLLIKIDTLLLEEIISLSTCIPNSMIS